jgi:hypothetical protein
MLDLGSLRWRRGECRDFPQVVGTVRDGYDPLAHGVPDAIPALARAHAYTATRTGRAPHTWHARSRRACGVMVGAPPPRLPEQGRGAMRASPSPSRLHGRRLAAPCLPVSSSPWLPAGSAVLSPWQPDNFKPWQSTRHCSQSQPRQPGGWGTRGAKLQQAHRSGEWRRCSHHDKHQTAQRFYNGTREFGFQYIAL